MRNLVCLHYCMIVPSSTEAQLHAIVAYRSSRTITRPSVNPDSTLVRKKFALLPTPRFARVFAILLQLLGLAPACDREVQIGKLSSVVIYLDVARQARPFSANQLILSAHDDMAAEPDTVPGVDYEDPTLGDDVSSETLTISSSVCDFPEENGRRYHAYHEGTYLYPNDEDEQDRLNLQHAIFRKLIGESLYLAPIEDPHHILDLGTGTGIWATEIADQHPAAEVIGVDLSPIQSRWVPINCKFEVFDYEEDWTFDRKFDLVCGRMLIGSISNPSRLFDQIFASLAPGGWVEIQDVCPPTTDDQTIPKGSAYQLWVENWVRGLRTAGRDPHLAASIPDLLRIAGFTKVQSTCFRVPQNTWPRDPWNKELGRLNEANITIGIEGLTLRTFIRNLGWTEKEVQVLLANVRRDIQDISIHAYWPV